VLDCWFESGSMPYAQFHYPFENKEKFESSFPGDFIAEYVGQVRAWFYYLHAISVGLFDQNSFNNCIVTGTLAGNDGRKMSKSYGNYTDPNELMDQFSADALRYLLLSSPLLNGEDFNLLDKDVLDVQRKLAMIWNMYDFFTMYAAVDGWEWNGSLDDPTDSLKNPLDVWIVSRLHQTQEHVTKHMDAYNIPEALSEILPFLEDASNWYVRRSRRRFWKSDDDADKDQAYTVLHYVLVQLSMTLAPFTPFLAEELYQKLTGGESVHLLDWSQPGVINQDELVRMAFAREVINQGLSQRAAAGIKVRQPLQSIRFEHAPEVFKDVDPEYEYMIMQELNVKQVTYDTSEGELQVALELSITPELRREGLMREVVRYVQNARKKAGLNVDDRIVLCLVTDDDELQQAIDEHAETITAETLAVSLGPVDASYEVSEEVDGKSLVITLKKT